MNLWLGPKPDDKAPDFTSRAAIRSGASHLSSDRFGANAPVVSRIRDRRSDLRQDYQSYLNRFHELGVLEDIFLGAQESALRHGSSIHDCLIATGAIEAEAYFALVARDLGLPFSNEIQLEHMVLEAGYPGAPMGKPAQVFCRNQNGLLVLHIAPDRSIEIALREMLERDPSQSQRIVIVPPRVIALAILQKKSAERLEAARNKLNQEQPALSAKMTFLPWQAYILGLISVAIPQWIYWSAGSLLTVLHIILSILFSFALYVRIFALRHIFRTKKQVNARLDSGSSRYSVLVALHKEAAVAGQIVRSMSALDWPQEHLEVLYLCEAGDLETIAALKAQYLPPNHQVIAVPPGTPQTKPKALNYGLSHASGDFLVIYDAEDRPHPGQLKEAYSTLNQPGTKLACVQAPLLVTNKNAGWLANMFAFEYRVHFTALLPYLAAIRIPLPLGGTSNHFRRSALIEAGAWDPYNVTEDADLGIRFARFGYDVGVIGLPTLEDGPETLREWFPQRTRWQKGWMQTALVHIRTPGDFSRAIGWKKAIYFGGLMAGFVLSPLLYLMTLVILLPLLLMGSVPEHPFLLYDLMLLCMGFFGFTVLGFATDKRMTGWEKVRVVLTLPLYWLLIGVAAWRGLYQLVRKPHYWEKTPHRPVRAD